MSPQKSRKSTLEPLGKELVNQAKNPNPGMGSLRTCGLIVFEDLKMAYYEDVFVGGDGTSTQGVGTVSGAGGDTKYDSKRGDDVIIGSTGNDLLIGGQGSDYLFGGAGADVFEFSKFATVGDHDYITDFNLALGDTLKIWNGATIIDATAAFLPEQSMNGRSLFNDARVYDLTLTLQVNDGAKSFTYEVTLMDVIKNQTFSADQYESYLSSLGYNGGIEFI